MNKIITLENLETFAEINDTLKADKDVLATTGNLAKFDENGNPIDSGISIPSSGNATSTLVVKGNDSRLTDPRPASDVYSWAKAESKPSYTKGEIGLGNVTNDAQVKRTEMGAASGVATLDENGKVPSSQLPSYVDDVLEYDTKSAFPATGEGGKIYVDKSNNTSWRWSGSQYTQIKGDLTIGITTGTAADGKIVNDHINNTSNPHGVTKAQVGLDSVVNTGDSDTPVSGGTTKFTTGGAYTELNKKVDKIEGKGLSTNDYTTTEKDKLSSIESGAQTHKAPTTAEVKSALGTGSGTSKYLREDGTWQTPPDTNTWRPLGTTSDTACAGDDSRLSNSRPASDVYSWAKAASKPSYSFSEISGTVSSSQLPSYVDDVLEYDSKSSFPTAGESGKIYVAKDTNLTWRWSGSTYVEISPSLALGETSSTAYAGDKGAALKSKLDGIESGALVHRAPTTDEVKSALGTGSGTSKYLREDGQWVTPPDTNTWPTYTSLLTNNSGFITSITKAMVTEALGYTPSSSDTNTWRPITNTYTGSDESTSVSQAGTNALYNALVNGYASSAGNSSTVNGHTVNSDVPAGAVFTDTDTWRPLGTGANDACAGNDSRLSNARPASDVYSWAKASSKPSYSYGEISGTPSSLPASDVYAWAKASSKPSYNKSEIGLGNVDNTADADKSVNYANSAGYASSAGSAPASDVYSWAKAESKPSYTKGEIGLGNVTNDAQVKRTEMGAASGIATLDATGKVPSSQLPSYVDEVTWNQLKTLRDGGLLTAEQWYRITDYETTVLSAVEPNARSAGHAFDILVRADSTTQLNEDAYAIHHSGDTYFDNSNLAAWKLKYTLDNVKWSQRPITVVTTNDDYYSFIETGTIEIDGTTYILWTGNDNFYNDWERFAISEDSEEGTTLYVYYDDGEFSEEGVGEIESKSTTTGSGKGIITWMKDEFGNELSYDFKNIQFKRFYTSDAKGRDGINGCYMVADPNKSATNLSVDDTDNFIWAYTFSSDREGGTQTDTSLAGSITNNVIGSTYDSLPNNVFYGTRIYSNTFGDYCSNNSIGDYFQLNIIGTGFGNNSIGGYFQLNIIGISCFNNSIGDFCRTHSIGNNCYNNSIGNYCSNNSIGNDCYNNSIGGLSQHNSIGNGCYNNSIGNAFKYNSIGNFCHNNSIGNNCCDNSIGNECYVNSIGNAFQYNSIGNFCNNIKIKKDYVSFIVIENGNRYIDITSTQTTSSAQALRNFTVAQGVNNSNSTKTISHNTTNDTFKTTYQNVNSTTTNV